MCDLLKVSRSAYYAWFDSTPSPRQLERQQLADKVKEIFWDHARNYGARRIRHAMQAQGFVIRRRRVSKLMKSQGLYCKTKRKFKATTDSRHTLPIAPNLLARDFSALAPDQKYVGDITYIWTQEGWLYLATVIDLFSRKIVGWAMQDHMKAELVNEALLMAIWRRKPERGLLWHTDRGAQYASQSHRDILGLHGITQSMSRKGNCWDNSVAESFFKTLKTELTRHINYKTKDQAKQSIFEYIEVYYNRRRSHSANNYLTPEAFEMLKKLS